MTLKSGLTRADAPRSPWPLADAPCKCLAAFFREEFAEHRRWIRQQREHFSDSAVEQAEDVLARVMGQIDRLCQRDDAGEVIEQLLRQLDLITKLSTHTETRHLH